MDDLALIKPSDRDILAGKIAVLQQERTKRNLIEKERLNRQRLKEKEAQEKDKLKEKEAQEKDKWEKAQGKFAVLFIKLTQKHLKVDSRQIREKFSEKELFEIATTLAKMTKPHALIQRVLTYGLVIGSGFYIAAVFYLGPLLMLSNGWSLLLGLPPLNPCCILIIMLVVLFGKKEGLGSYWQYQYFYNLLKKKYGAEYLSHQKIKTALYYRTFTN